MHYNKCKVLLYKKLKDSTWSTTGIELKYLRGNSIQVTKGIGKSVDQFEFTIQNPHNIYNAQTFSGDNSTLAFTLAFSLPSDVVSDFTGDSTLFQVFVDDVEQTYTTDYSVSGSTLTFVSAPATGNRNIEVRHAIITADDICDVYVWKDATSATNADLLISGVVTEPSSDSSDSGAFLNVRGKGLIEIIMCGLTFDKTTVAQPFYSIIQTLLAQLNDYNINRSLYGAEENEWDTLGNPITKRDGSAFPNKEYFAGYKNTLEQIEEVCSDEYTEDGQYIFWVEYNPDTDNYEFYCRPKIASAPSTTLSGSSTETTTTYTTYDACSTADWTGDAAAIAETTNTTTYQEYGGTTDATALNIGFLSGGVSSFTYNKTLASPINGTGGTFHIYVYIKDTATLNKIETSAGFSSSFIRLGSDSSNYYRCDNSDMGRDLLSVGWNLFSFVISDLTAVGSPNIAALDYLRIYFDIESAASTMSSGDMIIDSIVISYSTTTTIGLNSTDTTVTVASTASWNNKRGIIKIDSEEISFTGKTATTFTGCTRGANGTTAATHANGATVYSATNITQGTSDGSVIPLLTSAAKKVDDVVNFVIYNVGANCNEIGLEYLAADFTSASSIGGRWLYTTSTSNVAPTLIENEFQKNTTAFPVDSEGVRTSNYPSLSGGTWGSGSATWTFQFEARNDDGTKTGSKKTCGADEDEYSAAIDLEAQWTGYDEAIKIIKLYSNPRIEAEVELQFTNVYALGDIITLTFPDFGLFEKKLRIIEIKYTIDKTILTLKEDEETIE